MSKVKSNLQVLDFLRILAEKEIQIQNAKKNLNEFPGFDQYLAFSRIDLEKKQYIEVQDLHYYLEQIGLFCSQKELKGIYFEKSETYSQMTYHDFLSIVSFQRSQYQNNNNSISVSQKLHDPKYISEFDRQIALFFDTSLEAYSIILQHREQIHEHPQFNCFAIFSEFDLEKKGYVDFQDFAKFAQDNERSFSNEQYQLILNHIGQHQDKITKQKFLNIFEGRTCKKCSNVQHSQNVSENKQQNYQRSSNYTSPAKFQNNSNNLENLKTASVYKYDIQSPNQKEQQSQQQFQINKNTEFQQVLKRADKQLYGQELKKFENLHLKQFEQKSPQKTKEYTQQNLDKIFNSSCKNNQQYKQQQQQQNSTQYADFILKQESQQIQRSLNEGKLKKKYLQDFQSTQQIFSPQKREKEFSDEFFIDYKASPSKNQFYKRDYGNHLDSSIPHKFLLGQERNSIQYNQSERVQTSNSDIRQCYNQQKLAQKSLWQDKQQFQEFSSPLRNKKEYPFAKQQLRQQQSLSSQKQQNQMYTQQQQNTNQNVKSDISFLSPIITSKYRANQLTTTQGSPLLSQRNFPTQFNSPNQNMDTVCQEKNRKDLMENDQNVKIMIRDFLEGLDNISQISNQIEEYRCKISKNVTFSIQDLFKFYVRQVSGISQQYIGSIEFLELFRDFKLIVKEIDSVKVLKSFDRNGDRVLNEIEFEKIFMPQEVMYRDLLQQREKQLKQQQEKQMQANQLEAQLNQNNTAQTQKKEKLISDIVSQSELRTQIKHLLHLLLQKEQKYEQFRKSCTLSKHFDAYKLYQCMDQEENGIVNFVEFEQFLKEGGFLAPNKVYLELFNLFDTNLDGIISFSEFITQLNPKHIPNKHI